MLPIFLRQTLLDKQIAIETKSNAIIKRKKEEKNKEISALQKTRKVMKDKHNDFVVNKCLQILQY